MRKRAALRASLACRRRKRRAEKRSGRIYLNARISKKAIGQFEPVVQTGKVTASLLVDLGYCYLNTGRLAEARRRLEQALELEPANRLAQFNLGMTLVKLGQADEAQKALQKSLEEPSVSAQAHNELARLLTAKGEIERAIDHCRQAIEARSYLADTHYQLGRLLARQGLPEEARESFERYEKLTEIEERVNYLEHQIQLSQDVEAYIELARLYRQQGRSEKALETLRVASEGAPGQAILQIAIADLLRRQGRSKGPVRLATRLWLSNLTIPRPSINSPPFNW